MMVAEQLKIDKIKALFPNEWVLIGNPQMDDCKLEVIAGVPIYHSKDKREVCYIGRDKTTDFNKVTLLFTGEPKPTRKITGFFNRLT